MSILTRGYCNMYVRIMNPVLIHLASILIIYSFLDLLRASYLWLGLLHTHILTGLPLDRVAKDVIAVNLWTIDHREPKIPGSRD